VLFVTTFGVQNSVIPTASMEDTLLIGDYLLVNKVAFSPADARRPAAWLGQRPLRRGDVVVFKYPPDPRTDYIKRVVGLPGDVVEIRDKRLLVNGVELEEPHAFHKTGIIQHLGSPGLRSNRDNFGPVQVPVDSILALGDNRDYSADSREWGCVPRDHVTGRAFVIFWSRHQRPGAWQARGWTRLRGLLDALRRFPVDTRWSRIGTVVE
jgi:signal peptidase I